MTEIYYKKFIWIYYARYMKLVEISVSYIDQIWNHSENIYLL